VGGEGVIVPAPLFLDFMEEPDHFGEINLSIAIEIHQSLPVRLCQFRLSV